MKQLAKDIEEQLKLTHKDVEVADRPHRKIALLQCGETRDFIR